MQQVWAHTMMLVITKKDWGLGCKASPTVGPGQCLGEGLGGDTPGSFEDFSIFSCYSITKEIQVNKAPGYSSVTILTL